MNKFDFEKAVKELLTGKKIGGKDGVLAPLVKELIEAALLSNRGVKYILIASVDGLKGFPEAINANISEYRNSVMCNSSDKKFFKIRSFQKSKRVYERFKKKYIRQYPKNRLKPNLTDLKRNGETNTL